MNDLEALMQALIEEVVRRKKAEAMVVNMTNENQRLAARVNELEKPAEPANGDMGHS